MKHLDIVRYKKRYWIAINVSRVDYLRSTLNARNAGLHLFTGKWYGHDVRDHRNYGKITQLDCRKRIGARVITPVRSRYATGIARRLGKFQKQK